MKYPFHQGADMPESGRHCPFLNREDTRCAECFTVNHMDHAFAYCFDRYKACPMYLELLVERRLKQTQGTGTAHGIDVPVYSSSLDRRVALAVVSTAGADVGQAVQHAG